MCRLICTFVVRIWHKTGFLMEWLNYKVRRTTQFPPYDSPKGRGQNVSKGAKYSSQVLILSKKTENIQLNLKVLRFKQWTITKNKNNIKNKCTPVKERWGLTLKPTKWPVHQTKTWISLDIHPLWSVFAVCLIWVAKELDDREKMLGMKNNFDINDSIKLCEVDIAGVACNWKCCV